MGAVEGDGGHFSMCTLFWVQWDARSQSLFFNLWERDEAEQYFLIATNLTLLEQQVRRTNR